MSDFGEGRWVVGRKPHRCEYCYGPIPKSERQFNYHGTFDGEWQNWRMHAECYADYSSCPDSMIDGFMPGQAEMPERIKALISH